MESISPLFIMAFEYTLTLLTSLVLALHAIQLATIVMDSLLQLAFSALNDIINYKHHITANSIV